MKYLAVGIFLLACVGCAGPPFIDHLAGGPSGLGSILLSQ